MRFLRRPLWPVVLAIAFALGAGGITYGWTTFSGYYAILPDPANATAEVVRAEGGEPPAEGSGFYFVDVSVLRTNEIQKLWAEHLIDDATLVPESYYLSPGESEEQRLAENRRAMTDSKTTAAVVAQRALGYEVPIAELGAQVLGVVPDYPADEAGVEPGVVIVRANGRTVRDAESLVKVLGGLSPGDSVRLQLRDGSPLEVGTVENPEQPGRAVMGVSIGDAVRVGDPPVEVRITTPGIGGPSAGLAFALEIYDSLSDRTLLKGHRIAVTGELDLDGNVGGIGAVKQKTAGAIDVGADVFIVPEGDNERDARAAADGQIRIIGVETFAEALDAIRRLRPL